MSLELPLVIVNPAAAGGTTGQEWPGLASRIRDNFGPFTCEFTGAPGDARRIAQAAAQAGRRLILACGGDGTLSETASGILDSGRDCQLALLPSGTGGDFRKTLELPARFADAARALARGQQRRIDVGEISYFNLKGLPETRYFINVASFGMGGEVAKRIKSASKSVAGKTLGGLASYAYATLATTISFEAPEVLLEIDGDAALRRRISNFVVANGRYFGGGMKIAPEAKLDDGHFDLILIKEIGLSELLANAPRLYNGRHLDLPQVSWRRATTVVAKPAQPNQIIRLEVDGEEDGRLPATFRLLPRALSLLTV